MGLGKNRQLSDPSGELWICSLGRLVSEGHMQSFSLGVIKIRSLITTFCDTNPGDPNHSRDWAETPTIRCRAASASRRRARSVCRAAVGTAVFPYGGLVMPVTKSQALDYHLGERPGKIEVTPSKPCRTQRDLSLAYTPGVAEPCLEIQRNPHDALKYTARGNIINT